ncbi:hypothetical protein EDB85DRAFT_1930060 [Lactarius pseudohatsudake]|nr:hypothetical protein EDB85DRAFT_1930060 [Lactarius pseudohatsudake]
MNAPWQPGLLKFCCVHFSLASSPLSQDVPMHDGVSLRQAWYNALNDAQSSFRRFLTSSSSSEWKRVPVPGESTSLNSKGKGRSSVPELSDVIVHRKSTKSEDTVYRVILDVPAADDTIPFDAWKSILATPELRQEWDPAVDGAVLLEMLDPTTRISKTNFTLGWPANPRDAVTISRTFNDATTIIDVSTSLPRSPDEPAYLRPSPPYVRSNVKLFAWCIQSLPPVSSQQTSPADTSTRKTNPGRLRITCFWQHDLRALWNIGTASSLPQQLASMVLGLLKTTIKRRSRVPLLTGYGNGVAISRIRFDLNRESLTLEYSVIPEDEDHHSTHSSDNLQGLDELHAIREHRRLTRTVEFGIPLHEGWDIQISTQASSDKVSQLPWSASAYRGSSAAAGSTSGGPTSDTETLLYRVKHAALLNDHSLLKVQVVIERSASSGLRLNGLPQSVESIEERNPAAYLMSPQMLQDATSTADISFHTVSSAATVRSTLSGSSASKGVSQPLRSTTERSAAQEKSILSRVRRNYIYFSSLLQEPEAKWKRTTEARGVSVTAAEATFVGVGLWDLYAAIASPGARPYWDKQHEEAALLEDVNELTELWHFKSRPTWPANPRDAVLLKTVYKSPSTAHIFSFSADEPNLFPNTPQVEANTIRTQVDLQGFAIEALSPTTTLLTLLEQSDPKGWTNKTSIPQQMITTLAGIGEFAIKCGGPPQPDIRYDHERALFRIEYEVSASKRTPTSPQISSSDSQSEGGSLPPSSTPIVECELRCDMDTWAASLDIVIDPPPQSISCLRRHRLSSGGGGLWLTLTHDAVLAGEERLLAIVRRSPGRERVSVDSLSKQKRVKPPRIPLDQPPVLGVIRRRHRDWSGEGDDSSTEPPKSRNSTWSSAAMEQAATTTQQAVAAISPSSSGDSPSYSSCEYPLQYALNALQYLQALHSRSTTGFPLHRKLSPEISTSLPVYKGEREIAAVRWDDRFVGAGGAHTAFTVSKANFPFRDRGFYLASILARGQREGKEGASDNRSPPFFCLASAFTTAKYNPYNLPIGRMFIDGWILETLDPYTTTENYAIPSTRCTRVVSADYAGSLPAAVNAVGNTTLVKTLLSVEAYIKGIASLPFARLPAAGMLLADKRTEEHTEPSAWTLKQRDESRVLVQTRWTPDDRVYRGVVLLTTPAAEPVPPPAPPTSPNASSSKFDQVKTALGSGPPSSSAPATPEMTDRSVSSSTATPMLRRVTSAAIGGRSPSAFTVRGEVRQAADLLVAEVVGYHPISLLPAIAATGDSATATAEITPEPPFLPLVYSVYTLPSSPLHSSGLAVDHPPRHLLRLTLPTAQTQISTLLDPLTGETRAPPPKPQWLLDLSEKGAVIEVEILPATQLVAAGSGKRTKSDDGTTVTIDGVVVKVEGEKESLTSLGREELQDDRVAWMAVLSRYSSECESDKLPTELRNAVAVADTLLEPNAVSEKVATPKTEDREEGTATGDGEDNEKSRSMHPPQCPGTPKTASPTIGSGSGTLLGFLNGYPNPLLRFTSGSGSTSHSHGGGQSGSAASLVGEGSKVHRVGCSSTSGRELESRQAAPSSSGMGTRRFTLWTVIVIGLISFLIGSLLRSLISPADFIYVATDLGEMGEMSGGWREVKRLVEVKHIVGGWDFQIAVVRRH